MPVLLTIPMAVFILPSVFLIVGGRRCFECSA
jgi:hypothetical protein